MPNGLCHSYRVRKTAVTWRETKMPSHMDQWRGHMKAPMGAAVSRVRTWAGRDTEWKKKPYIDILQNMEKKESIVIIKCYGLGRRKVGHGRMGRTFELSFIYSFLHDNKLDKMYSIMQI